MAFSLDRLYYPLTAQPFKCNKNYIEIAPCDALKPYICCFWGAKSNAVPDASEQSQSTLVIPDTCMDIIFNVNYTKEKISAAFCGINDKSFIAYSNNTDDTACTFAIRFYAWSVVLFSDCAVSEALNIYVDAQVYFDTIKRQLERLLLGTQCIEERIKMAEAFLLQRLNASRENANVMNALFWIVKNHGNVTVRDLSAYTHISSRQLERLFQYNTGVSPKQMANLIRYQMLWREVVQQNFDVQDAVQKYGFTDQAHLLHSFKNFHTMTPIQARVFAAK